MSRVGIQRAEADLDAVDLRRDGGRVRHRVALEVRVVEPHRLEPAIAREPCPLDDVVCRSACREPESDAASEARH